MIAIGAPRINPFEQAGRERKARMLVIALDAAFRTARIDPWSRSAFLAVETLSDGGWRSAAIGGGVTSPSVATREIVISIYRDRANHAVIGA